MSPPRITPPPGIVQAVYWWLLVSAGICLHFDIYGFPMIGVFAQVAIAFWDVDKATKAIWWYRRRKRR